MKTIVGAAAAALLLAACATQPDGTRRIDAMAIINTAACVAPVAEQIQAIENDASLDRAQKAAETAAVIFMHGSSNPACVAMVEALRRPAGQGQ